MDQFIEKQWYVYAKRAPFNELAQSLGIDPVTVRILRNRDLVTEEDMDRFLNAGLKDLYDASLLPDIDKAAELIIQTVNEGEKIRIVGDYDIDGVCSTYILCDGLMKIGADVDHVIPDRVRDGYGINVSIVEKAHDDKTDLILTCDNGISAMDALEAAAGFGIKVIVTDHHDIKTDPSGNEILPEAECIVNAKRRSSVYPEKEICGAVTAWKLLEVIYKKCGIPHSEWEKYLEFAAMATIGDVMKLQGENRIIAGKGLLAMSRAPINRGLIALTDLLGLKGKDITCYHVGFVIGPCINAGGRLETAETALKLFMSQEDSEANALALSLKDLNDSRKYLTQQGTEEAVREVLGKYMNDRVLIVFLPMLHESMAGIVAGRLKEKFGKPSFVITLSETEAEDENGVSHRILKGSGRSIETYNMFEGLREADGLIYKYGGHPMAAGLSIFEENIDALRKTLNDNCRLTDDDLTQKVWIDAPMPMSYVTEKLILEWKRLEPFGNGNKKPLFAEKGVRVANMSVLGKKRNALRMDLISADGKVFRGIMFGEADLIKKDLEAKHSVNIVYCPGINEYNGNKTVQMQIEEVR